MRTRSGLSGDGMGSWQVKKSLLGNRILGIHLVTAMYDDLPDVALSIRQPWVFGILKAGKPIENRNRRTHFRGSVCIHSSLYKPTQDDVDDFNHVFHIAVPDSEKRSRICPRFTEALSFNRCGIVGIVDIVDCVEKSDSPWFFGPYGYVLRNARVVPFIPCSGMLGFFKWKDRVTNAA